MSQFDFPLDDPPPRRWWNPFDRRAERDHVIYVQLDTLLMLERANYRRIGELLMASQESLDLLKRIDAATTNIAGDIRRLKDRSDDPEVKAGLEAAASRLEQMTSDPENPDPENPETPAA